jgi:predicted AAA+ superfamily ATPase
MAVPPYTPRIVDDELDELLRGVSALAIEGPKAVGKTATGIRRARTVHELDDRRRLDIAASDVDRVVNGEPPVLIDEWQLLPPVWDRVRRAVDRDPTPGRFILTGSASPAGAGSHSGAGRIVTLRMRPLSLAERLRGHATVSLGALLRGERGAIEGRTDVALEGYVDEILRSGLPGIHGLPERAREALLAGYVTRIVDRDFPELGRPVRNVTQLRAWMAAYASATATTTSFEKLRDAATSGHSTKPAKTTVQPYREILERLFIIDPVPGWRPRAHLKELALAPKHHLADPALAATLVNVSRDALLAGGSPGPIVPRDGTFLGALFESLVTLSVRVYAQAIGASIHHFRTHRGDHEVDLVVEGKDGRVLAIEVKLSATVPDDAVRHLDWFGRRFEHDVADRIVITTGPDAYRRKDGIAVIPAALLGP